MIRFWESDQLECLNGSFASGGRDEFGRNIRLLGRGGVYSPAFAFWIIVSVPGSSPGGSRVIRRWGWNQCPRKKLNYRYIERLEMDSVVGNISGEKEAE